MEGSVVFVANGFDKENCRLQPWRYVYELARYRARFQNVYVLTEGVEEREIQEWEDGLIVVRTNCLSVRRQYRLNKVISSLNPDEVWWSSTPRTIAYYPVLSRLECRKIAFITCPLYRWGELIRASIAGVPYVQSKALWSQRLIPRFMLRMMLNSQLFEHVVVQSQNNFNILERHGVKLSKLSILPVGIDTEDAEPVNEGVLNRVKQTVTSSEKQTLFLYLGALRPIRGFDALLNAFPDVVKKNPQAKLLILARGADNKKCADYLQQFQLQGIADNVMIIGGWLEKEEVRAYIELSDIVVLPFVLVPSDIPIAALEALARSKPVIVSNVDGLPELAQGRGLVVDPLNKDKFSSCMSAIVSDGAQLTKYQQAANDFMQTYPRWSDVGTLMDEICSKYR